MTAEPAQQNHAHAIPENLQHKRGFLVILMVLALFPVAR